MNFQPTEEQEMLRQSLRTAFARAGQGADGGMALTGLEILGLLVPEDLGGNGLGMSEATIVLNEAGRAGATGDLAAHMLCTEALIRALPELANDALCGKTILAMPVSGELVATEGRLSGEVLVAMAESANTRDLWLAAPVDGQDEIALIPLVDLPCEVCEALEVGRVLRRYRLDLLKEQVAGSTLHGLRERLALMHCAEMLGAAEKALEMAIGYLKERRQFGQPIGANQALRHIAADCYVTIENAKIAVELAAVALDASADSADMLCVNVDKAVATALAYVPKAARETVETAIHLHGGIGLTWDYGLNAPLRRIVHLTMGFEAPAHWHGILCDLYRADIQNSKARP